MPPSLTISKLDAAKRQLETAIRIYFYSGDPVSLHTLTAAAYNVVRDLNEKRGGAPMVIKERMFEFVRPECQKELREKINEAENFFKHADRDHSATLEFHPNSTELLIFDACSKYVELSGEFPPLFQILNGWMMITHEEIFNLPDDQKKKLREAAKTFTAAGKVAYFNDMLPLVMKSVA